MASSPLSWPCDKCGKLSQSTLEEIASGPGLVARFNQRGSRSASSGLDIVAAAASNDRDALDVLRSAGEALGSAVGWLVNVLDPQAVIVGGSIGLSKGPYWESFLASTRRHIWSDAHRALPILQASTGQAAGIIGAAATAWKKICSN
jgi:predicted NBD/HSP70 family sugar kinase